MSLKINELYDLLSTNITIDEYQSKMGNDEDVIVIAMEIAYYDPALELSNFIEKGYEWVLDADVSPGENEDGKYFVFIEMLRRPSFPEHLIKILSDLEGITTIDQNDYTFSYFGDTKKIPLSIDSLKNTVPLSPRAYKMDDIKDIAGIKHKTGDISADVRDFVNSSKGKG